METSEPDVVGTSKGDHELAIVRHQIASALFPRIHGASTQKIGRFVVERRIGAGAMGVVYAARDPALDRRVAIKLVRPDASGDRRAQLRLEREARALAKLSHPNIVAIHEVGEHHGQLFLAMEHVRGESLRAWQEAKPRSVSEVLGMYLQAGRGLAAAHAAGLVHRDFKPDNVLVDDSGRARVVDFGLVGSDDEGRRAELARWQAGDEHPGTVVLTTHTHALVGTPAYMSPEQFEGVAVDARSDQFAFCVALWEAVYGERPFRAQSLPELSAQVLAGKLRRPTKVHRIPGWLRQTCERGLSIDPRQRWPSMEALLDALTTGRTRARARRGLAAVGVLVALGVGAEGYRRHDRAQQTAACEAAGDEITSAWNDERRQALHAALLATELDYAATTADKVMPWLDRQAEEWREARVEACLDTWVRDRWDAKVLDRSLWCLDERRMEVESLVDELTDADAQVVEKAVSAVTGLVSVTRCRDERVLEALPVPPEDDREKMRAVRAGVIRSGNLSRAGRYAEGLVLARESLAGAEVLQWPPLAAAARFQVGLLLGKTGDYVQAEPVLEDAYFEAADGVAPKVAFEAASLLVYVVGHGLERHAEGRRWGRHAELALARLHEGDDLSHASLSSYLASVDLVASAYEQAKLRYERALSLKERVLGHEHPEVAAALANLASVHLKSGESDRAKALYEQALSIRERALGPDHPDVGSNLGNLGNLHDVAGDHERAKLLLERALVIQEHALGPKHPRTAQIVNNLANVYYHVGDYERARALYERNIVIKEQALGPEHPEVAMGLSNLGNVYNATGEHERALAVLERALAISTKALGPDHRKVAECLLNLGNVHVNMKDYERAKNLYERALSILEATDGPNHNSVATCLANLATIARFTGDYEQAEALYRRALSIREQVLGSDHPSVALLIFGLAKVALGQRRPADAVPLAERAVALQEKGSAPVESLASSRYALAQALWDAPVGAGRDRGRARALAAQARDAYGAAGQRHADDLAEVEAWLEAHAGSP